MTYNYVNNTPKRVAEIDDYVGSCCRQLSSALADPYLDPEAFNLYVLDGRLYLCFYNDRHARLDEPLNYCPWCAKRISPPEPQQTPAVTTTCAGALPSQLKRPFARHASFANRNATIPS